MASDKKECWKELVEGGYILEAGNSEEYETGSWRTYRPRWIPENCIQCLFCFIYCPDSSVTVKDGKRGDFNYKFCKGCGICAKECPAKNKAIVMELEVKGE
ncbi:MAG: 4Fe-4S binding protein [bacterium]